MSEYLVVRLLQEAIWQDRMGNPRTAALLTEAVKEIENARKGHVRNPADESTKPEGDEQYETGDGA